MKLHCDWHMHSQHSPCGAEESSYVEVVKTARAAGLTEFGITDHLHGRRNEEALRRARADFEGLKDGEGVHFGLEVSCVRKWDVAGDGADCDLHGHRPGGPAGDEPAFYLPAELLSELKAEYVIGGVHWPQGVPWEREAVIRSYHRQYLSCAAHPRVNVVAHPWWWAGHWQGADGKYTTLPWFDDFSVIPRSMHDELAAAAREHDTAVEINAGAVFHNGLYPQSFKESYLEYLAYLKERGVRFSVATDSHRLEELAVRLELLETVVEKLGLREEEIWRPGT